MAATKQSVLSTPAMPPTPPTASFDSNVIMPDVTVFTDKIVPTAEEKALFDLILGAVTALELNVVIRVAGGWVRDKLLNHKSHDIDFTLSNMTGADFASRIKTYLQLKGLNQQLHNIGVIKCNPNQSKQLETVTFNLNGISIDVNNLRTETYNGDGRDDKNNNNNGRIPVMAMGTAQQDSERRDFTINAMYYNIHTGMVEDLVNGLDDLSARLVRTPLPPMLTFSEDPLRILRAARLAGRFGCTIHADIEKAAMEPSIQDKLLRKVSRERYGQEVAKMLSSVPDRATLSIHYLVKWGLVPIIFALPIDANTIVPDLQLAAKLDIKPLFPLLLLGDAKNKRALADVSMHAMGNMAKIISTPLPRIAPVIAEEKKLLLLSSFLSPYYGWKYCSSKKPYPMSSYIVIESLRLSKSDADTSFLLLQSAHSFRQLACRAPWLKATSETDGSLGDDFRVQLGHILVGVKEQWPLAFELALALHQSVYGPSLASSTTGRSEMKLSSSSSSFHAPGSPLVLASPWTLTESSPAIVHLLHWLVRDSNLVFPVDDTAFLSAASSSTSSLLKTTTLTTLPTSGAWVWKLRPYFTGKDLGNICKIKPGLAIGEMMAKQLEWRFMNPIGTIAECEAWLRAQSLVI